MHIYQIADKQASSDRISNIIKFSFDITANIDVLSIPWGNAVAVTRQGISMEDRRLTCASRERLPRNSGETQLFPRPHRELHVDARRGHEAQSSYQKHSQPPCVSNSLGVDFNHGSTLQCVRQGCQEPQAEVCTHMSGLGLGSQVAEESWSQDSRPIFKRYRWSSSAQQRILYNACRGCCGLKTLY